MINKMQKYQVGECQTTDESRCTSWLQYRRVWVATAPRRATAFACLCKLMGQTDPKHLANKM